MQRDSGYPPNWMADIVRLLPKRRSVSPVRVPEFA